MCLSASLVFTMIIFGICLRQMSLKYGLIEQEGAAGAIR